MSQPPKEGDSSGSSARKSNTWLVMLIVVAVLAIPALCVCGGIVSWMLPVGRLVPSESLPPGPSPDRGQEAAIAEIENFGAEYERDESRPRRPVVKIVFRGPQVTDAVLETVQELTDLEWLGFVDTKVTDAGLVHLKRLKRLKTLDFMQTDITDAGLQQIAELTSLQTLNVAVTPVTDAGLEHLKKLSNLRVLYLLNTKVTQDGVEMLQRELPNCEIHH